METLSTVEELCAQHQITPVELADRCGLDLRRVRAIINGQWTPSPAERDKVAAAFGLTRDRIEWGHRTGVDHIYGHGPQFGRSP
jgi:hypothetical protein